MWPSARFTSNSRPSPITRLAPRRRSGAWQGTNHGSAIPCALRSGFRAIRRFAATQTSVVLSGVQGPAQEQDQPERGWEIIGIYEDSGVSGAKASRPGLDKMMQDARVGKIDIIAVWKLDRLGRSVANLLAIAESLNAWGVGLVSVRDAHVDSTTPSGRFTLLILSAVAELERGPIERVIAGIRRAQAAGKHCGRPRRETADKALVAAKALLDQGWSWRAVAEATGIPKDTLRRRLAEQVSQKGGAGEGG